MNFLSGTLIITDLEATCWEEKKHSDKMETIQIASAAVPIVRGNFCGEEGHILVDELFDSFVKPQVVPQLSAFCKNLTKITQSQVDAAPYFPEVFMTWINWIKEYDAPIFASWGWYDYNQLVKDTKRFPYWVTTMFEYPHFNIKTYVGNVLNRKKKLGISSVLQHLGMEFEGSPHNGMDDVKNIIRILEKINGQ